jgi:nickel-dependent lactate racemase
MAEISIPWGEGQWPIPLPADWEVQQVARPAVPPASRDWPERLAGALSRPEGTSPLAELLAAEPAPRVTLIVEDVTRHSPLPQILQVIWRELDHARIPRENVEVFFATGMHPAMTAEQAAGKLGDDLAGRVRWRSNPWSRPEAYVNLGRLQDGSAEIDLWLDRGVAAADLRIVVSAVSPHLQAGFGGGAKMLLPGCARLDSIRQLHLAGLPRRAQQMVGRPASGNRMRRLIDAAGRLVDAGGGKTFAVQYVQDSAGRLASIAAGDLAACQRMLAKQSAAGNGVLIEAPADVIVTSSYPRDADLWQSFKAIANTCWAARDNGEVICLSRCLEGMNMPAIKFRLSGAMLRRVVRTVGSGPLSGLLTRAAGSLAADAAFFVRMALQVLERTHVTLVSPALVEAGHSLPGLDLTADPAEAVAAADRRLNAARKRNGSGSGGAGRAKRVIVFPHGGVSYPILRYA